VHVDSIRARVPRRMGTRIKKLQRRISGNLRSQVSASFLKTALRPEKVCCFSTGFTS
jgi:hypothetical protein